MAVRQVLLIVNPKCGLPAYRPVRANEEVSAMADTLDALSGVMVVGFHGGVQGDRFPFLVVMVEDPMTHAMRERRVEVVGFNPGTGEPTELGLQLQKVSPGERIAVGVFANVLDYTVKPGKEQSGQVAGQTAHMVVYRAAWITSLTAQASSNGRRAASADV
jgi:hypothetical protein